MTAPDPIPTEPYVRPTISASRLKCIGGEKGSPGCERRCAAHYLFNMKQASSPALEFGSALHAMAEVFQDTGEVIEPEGDVARVFAAGAHLLSTCGPLLVEHEHVGTLPDGSPYVAYLDAHSASGGPDTGTVVIQDLKTTSNPNYALVGSDPPEDADPHDIALAGSNRAGDYELRRDLQCMFYAWILLCAPPHQFRAGPDDPWQTWDPAERMARCGRLRWVYFLTKGKARAWETNDFVTPAQAAAFLAERIMPLVAKINALHEWHHARLATGGPAPSLDEIDRTLDACRDFRGNYGRWCGAGEREACNYDQIGTPVLDLVQLKVRKMTTPQERLAALRNKNAAGAAAPPAAAAPQPAPVVEAPAASPPPPAPVPATTTAPEPQPVPPASPVVASSAPESTGSSETAAAALTRGQKAAQTRAANKAVAVVPTPPAPAGNINPPEVVEALAKLTALPAVAPITATQAAADLDQHISSLTVGQVCDLLIANGYAVSLNVGVAK